MPLVTQTTQTTTITIERPSEKPLLTQMLDAFLHQVIETTEEAHPAWEGKFEKVRYEHYCRGCGERGKNVCLPAVRCVRVKNQ